MSCPDWRAATSWRQADGAAPAAWQADLDHLARCADCRGRVAELDPALLLAAAAAPAPSPGAAEVDAIKSTVRSLVAAERLAGRRRPDRRALLAAAAVVAVLAVPPSLSRLAGRSAPPPPALPAAAVLEPPPAPPVEEVQPSAARVYQFGGDDLPVVFIFDENLDL